MGVEGPSFFTGNPGARPPPPPIADVGSYNARMAKSLIDKIYFLDKTPAGDADSGLFVDFGCADGAMLGFIARVFPGVRLLGYDNDPAMVAAAREAHRAEGLAFTSDWSEVARAVDANRGSGGKSCLVLSSVIHEIHSYLRPEEVDAIWRRVWGGDGVEFDSVAIRDMMVSRAVSRPSDPIQVARIRQVFDRAKLSDWEARWGSIEENWSLVHFLLTYRYSGDSWSRELAENYLPRNYEDFMASIPAVYFPVFKETFTLPFLRRQVKSDFGIDLADRTHLKLVLERQG